MGVSFAIGAVPWQPPVSDVETRARVERVLAIARVFFAVVTLAAIFMAPEDLSSDASSAYELLIAYAAFSATIVIVARLAPSYLFRAGLGIHLVDVLVATAITFLTRGAGAGAFVFFLFVLFAAPVRWGIAAAFVTAAAAVVLFLAEAQLTPLGSVHGFPVESTRTFLRTSYLVVLTVMLGFIATHHRTLRAESTAVARVLAGVCGTSCFSDGLRFFFDECLTHVGSTRALLALENRSTRQLHLWTASRTHGRSQITLMLEDLTAADRDTYFVRAPRNMMVWFVRNKNGRFVGRGVGEGTMDTVVPLDGSVLRAMLERHGATSALIADASSVSDWNGRLVLLDPRITGLDAFYFVRSLVRHVAPALHNEYLIRQLRSRVAVAERARLARELHDGLLQSLIGLEMEIEAIRRGADRATKSNLLGIRDHLRRDIADVRDSMMQLRLVRITGDDLLRIIADLSGRLRRETGMEVRLVSNGSFVDCVPRNCAHLARIVQEALTNVRKHSGAKTVIITVDDTRSGGRLTVEDDGRGFRFRGRLTLEQLEASDLGPAVLKERVRSMGGRLTIESTPGSGTRIEVEWPRVA